MHVSFVNVAIAVCKTVIYDVLTTWPIWAMGKQPQLTCWILKKKIFETIGVRNNRRSHQCVTRTTYPTYHVPPTSLKSDVDWRIENREAESQTESEVRNEP